MGSQKIIMDWLVSNILTIILSFMVGTFKTKNIDQVKETCVIITDHISLFSDSTMSSALNFCFLCIYFILI